MLIWTFLFFLIYNNIFCVRVCVWLCAYVFEIIIENYKMRRWYFVKVYGFLILLIASCSPSRVSSQLIPYTRVLNGSSNITCNFESSCSWKWSPDSFTNVSAAQLKEKFTRTSYELPAVDADGNELGMLKLIDNLFFKKSLFSFFINDTVLLPCMFVSTL